MDTNTTMAIPSGNNTDPSAEDYTEWISDVRFAIEGVTQLIVGIVGLVGKSTTHSLTQSTPLKWSH